MTWCEGYGMEAHQAFALGIGLLGSAEAWTSMRQAEKEATHDEAVSKALAQAGKS